MPIHLHQRSTAVSNGMSVDVEDYFHTEVMCRVVPRTAWDQMPCRVERNTERFFEIFANHGIRATFFFLGWVAERFPALVRSAKELGHEIGCHSYWHRPVYTLSPAEFREDTCRAKAVIEDIAGTRVFGYRAPSFSLTASTEWAAEILAQLGFVYDSSVHPIAHDLYENRDAPRFPYALGRSGMLEIPISTVSVGKSNLPFSGGGYFRILPYGYTRWAIRKANRADHTPVVFYLHPWEIDPEQPRLAAGPRSRFRQYTGLAGTERKLHQLLRDFSFAPLWETFARDSKLVPLPSEPMAKELQNVTPDSAQVGYLDP
jgi:polysaccharide deacetylase family protein (PEP-CTERM system associated)